MNSLGINQKTRIPVFYFFGISYLLIFPLHLGTFALLINATMVLIVPGIYLLYLTKGSLKINESGFLILLFTITTTILLIAYNKELRYLINTLPILGLYLFSIYLTPSNDRISAQLAKKYLKFFIYLIIIVIATTFIFYVNTPSQRKTLIWINDPNYSALVLLMPLLLSISCVYIFSAPSKQRVIHSILFLLIFIIFIKTESRGFLLSVVIFYLLTFIFTRVPDYAKRTISILLIVAPIILFYILGRHFISAFSAVDISNINLPNSRVFDIFTLSNTKRIRAFDQAYQFILERRLMFSGMRNEEYLQISHAVIIPHNWFVLTALNSGFFYAIILAGFLIRIVVTINPIFLPALVSVFLASSVLGSAALFTSIYVLSIFVYVQRKTEIKFSKKVIQC